MFDLLLPVWNSLPASDTVAKHTHTASEKYLSWAGIIITTAVTATALWYTRGNAKQTFTVMGTSAATFVAARKLADAAETALSSKT